MKKQAISKDYLITIIQQIVMKDGLDAISIRRLAEEANVSVGSVYNYFESKEAMIMAFVHFTWLEYFQKPLLEYKDSDNYTQLIHDVFELVKRNANEYHAIFASYYRSFTPEVKEQARAHKRRDFKVLSEIFLDALKHDPHVDNSIWTEKLTPEAFNQFVIHSLLDSIRFENQNVETLIELVNITLYPKK